MRPLLVHPTPEQIARANELYPFDALNNSITAGRSNIYGALGEILFSDLYAGWTKVESYNHDFVGPDDATVDIKTKRTTAHPEPHWNCTVAATSEHQRPDYLFFLRIMEGLTDAWVLGWMGRDDFYRTARFGKKDTPDPSARGWSFKADCWNVRIDELRPATPTGTTVCAVCANLEGSAPAFVDYTNWCGCVF